MLDILWMDDDDVQGLSGDAAASTPSWSGPESNQPNTSVAVAHDHQNQIHFATGWSPIAADKN